MDDVLKLVKDKKTADTKVLPPIEFTGTGKMCGVFDVNEAIEDMGTDDIMKYIEQNQQANGDEDLNLF